MFILNALPILLSGNIITYVFLLSFVFTLLFKLLRRG